MITAILSSTLFVIFTVLSGFHFYWLLGGTWGVDHVLPTKDDIVSPMKIPPLATLVVALGLLSLGVLYLIKMELIVIDLPVWIGKYAYWVIPTIFLFRAIGEFKYVGFFKKIRDTKFAKADTKTFTPLCLFIALIGYAIQLF